MQCHMLKWSAMFGLLAAIAVFAGGCGRQTKEPAGGSAPVAKASHEDHEGHDHESEGGHRHGGWWCAEHGVPEEECSMCSSKAADKFKAEGDWCDEHHRAESQCFLCDPARADKYVALYEAKFGKKPPKPAE